MMNQCDFPSVAALRERYGLGLLRSLGESG